jgi:hypothetical protein
MLHAMYGYRPDLPPFQNSSAEEQVTLLKNWGCDAVFGGYDDEAFVAAARRAGLLLLAEFGCFVGAHWWREVPASHPVTADGEPLAASDWYYGVNPSETTVRRRQLTALERLLREHRLDGVWLDFIRWPCHWEGSDPPRPLTSFDRLTVARFCRDRGLPLPPSNPARAAETILGQHAEVWCHWRCQQISDWVAEARELVSRWRPEALLGLFTVPWLQADWNDALRTIVGQDLAALGQYVDVFSPMVYHRMCGHPVAWIAEVTEEVGRLSGRAVWPIVQSVDKPESLPAEEFEEALARAGGSPAAQGIIVFTLEGLLADNQESAHRLAATKRQFGAMGQRKGNG